MPEKSLEEIIDKIWNRGLSCGGLAPYNPITEKKAREKATQAIKDYYLAKLPKEKEEKGYLSTDFRWHKDLGYNLAIDKMREAIEEG